MVKGESKVVRSSDVTKIKADEYVLFIFGKDLRADVFFFGKEYYLEVLIYFGKEAEIPFISERKVPSGNISAVRTFPQVHKTP